MCIRDRTTVLLEGNRVIPVEIQALVINSFYSMPKRTSQGVIKSKVEMLLAIMSKNISVNFTNKDVFVNVGGGFNLKDPTIDLAIVIAILSSFKNEPVESRAVYCGEISLSGVIIPPPMLEKRVTVSEKLGFQKFYANSFPKVRCKIFNRVESIGDL